MIQRDEKLAKTILQAIQSFDDDGTGLYREDIYPAVVQLHGTTMDEGELMMQVDYHLHLLMTGGFVLFYSDEEDDEDGDVFLITWLGHDYLEGKVR